MLFVLTPENDYDEILTDLLIFDGNWPKNMDRVTPVDGKAPTLLNGPVSLEPSAHAVLDIAMAKTCSSNVDGGSAFNNLQTMLSVETTLSPE